MPSFKLILYNVLLWFLVNAGLRNGITLTLILDLLAVTGAVIFTFIVSFLLPSQVPPPFSKVIFFSEGYIMCEQKTLIAKEFLKKHCVCLFTSELYIVFLQRAFSIQWFQWNLICY